MDRQAVVEYLASLTDEELAEIIAEVRGVNLDIKGLIERELARPAKQSA